MSSRLLLAATIFGAIALAGCSANGSGTGPPAQSLARSAESASCCTQLPLRAEVGYPTGVGVDPNNDNLSVLDNVYCAGAAKDGLPLTAAPTAPRSNTFEILNGNCPGQFRFDSTASVILFGDTFPELRTARWNKRICHAYYCIDQRTFPDVRRDRTYTSGYPGGFTTIPNTLPN